MQLKKGDNDECLHQKERKRVLLFPSEGAVKASLSHSRNNDYLLIYGLPKYAVTAYPVCF